MISKIETIEDVKSFAKLLITEGVSFHPDDNFNDIVDIVTKEPTYSKEEAEYRNALMFQCFEVCERDGLDIYDISLEVTLIETGMDKFIPLPSQPYPDNN